MCSCKEKKGKIDIVQTNYIHDQYQLQVLSCVTEKCGFELKLVSIDHFIFSVRHMLQV